jgi:hypothetical protein
MNFQRVIFPGFRPVQPRPVQVRPAGAAPMSRSWSHAFLPTSVQQLLALPLLAKATTYRVHGPFVIQSLGQEAAIMKGLFPSGFAITVQYLTPAPIGYLAHNVIASHGGSVWNVKFYLAQPVRPAGQAHRTAVTMGPFAATAPAQQAAILARLLGRYVIKSQSSYLAQNGHRYLRVSVVSGNRNVDVTFGPA